MVGVVLLVPRTEVTTAAALWTRLEQISEQISGGKSPERETREQMTLRFGECIVGSVARGWWQATHQGGKALVGTGGNRCSCLVIPRSANLPHPQYKLFRVGVRASHRAIEIGESRTVCRW